MANVRVKNRFRYGNLIGGILSEFFGHMIGANNDNDINDRLTHWWYEFCVVSLVSVISKYSSQAVVFQKKIYNLDIIRFNLRSNWFKILILHSNILTNLIWKSPLYDNKNLLPQIISSIISTTSAKPQHKKINTIENTTWCNYRNMITHITNLV